MITAKLIYMNTKKAIFLSYDLGLQGDYTNMYTWLDKIGAKECGNSVAFFTSNKFNGNIPKKIEHDLKGTVTFSKTDRVYIIYWNENEQKLKGRFIMGGRKRAVWEGYGQGKDDHEDSV